MSAISFAIVGGFVLGALSVAVRIALRRAPAIGAGSVLLNVGALATTVVVALVAGASADQLDLASLWPFLVIGAVVPGVTQMLWVAAVHTAGAPRTQVVLATSPLLAALLAVAFLDESWNVALVGGTLLVVLGGIALAWDRERPIGFKAVGIGLAVAVAILTGTRDTATRWALTDSDTVTGVEPAVTLAAACVVVATLAMLRRDTRFGPATLVRALPVFALPSILMGVGYLMFFEAFDRGEVTVVSPLVGTYALWSVVISAIVLPRTEAVGRRLVLASALVVGGVALVTAFRETEAPETVAAAVAAFREQPVEVVDPTGRGAEPRPGVYVYATQGGESIDFLLRTAHTYPDETPLTVVRQPCGFTERWSALTARTTERSFCVSPDGLALASYSERHRFVGQTDVREYVCEPPGLYLPAGAQIGQTWTLACSTPETTERWLATLVSIDSIVVEDEPQTVAEVRFDTTLSGQTNGTSAKRSWIRVEDNLLVREVVENDNTTGSPLGDVRYQESYQVELGELEPRE